MSKKSYEELAAERTNWELTSRYLFRVLNRCRNDLIDIDGYGSDQYRRVKCHSLLVRLNKVIDESEYTFRPLSSIKGGV